MGTLRSKGGVGGRPSELQRYTVVQGFIRSFRARGPKERTTHDDGCDDLYTTKES